MVTKSRQRRETTTDDLQRYALSVACVWQEDKTAPHRGPALDEGQVDAGRHPDVILRRTSALRALLKRCCRLTPGLPELGVIAAWHGN
ncbi:hypothetical protein KCP73_19175 [Salmonella enterica subsp. enterica]|nr:hypothetical protein KCP73_19175 [Salmonella enterica subsp. enterica]